MRALALVQLFALLASCASGTLLDDTRCESEYVPKSSRCTGCPPTFRGKLCASTTRYNDQTKAACGCGKEDPVPTDWWTLTQMTAALNCKNLDVEHPMKSWCPSGCGGCYELCSTGSTTNGNTTTAGVCRTFKVTNRCGDGYKEYPMWCSNELTWRECRDNPARCRRKGSTNWYGYSAHFDLQDFHLQISGGLGWDNVEVTFEPVPCNRWKGPAWNCKCNSSDARRTAWSATDASPSPSPAQPAAPTAVTRTRPSFPQVFHGLLPSPLAPPTLPPTMPPIAPVAPITVAGGWITVPSQEVAVAVVHTTVSPGYQQVATTVAPTAVPYAPHVAVVGSGWYGSSSAQAITAPSPYQWEATAAPSPQQWETTAVPTAVRNPAVKLGCSADGEQCYGPNWPGPYCCNTGCTCQPDPGDRSKYMCMPQTAGQTCSATRHQPRSAPAAAAPAPRPPSTLWAKAPLMQRSPYDSAPWTTTARPSQAQGPSDCGKAYEQCGGSQWTGTTCCQPGCRCASPEHNDYMQCRPLGKKPVCEASHAEDGLRGAAGGSQDLLSGAVASAVAADAVPLPSPLPDIGGAGRTSTGVRLLQVGSAIGLTSLLLLGAFRLRASRGRRRAESSRLLATYSSVPGEDAVGRGGQRWELPLRDGRGSAT